MTKYEILLKSGLTVFSINDLMTLWTASSRRAVLESVKGYLKRGKLFRIYQGIYSLSTDYDQLELPQKIFPPCYISYYSALAWHGIIFQYYSDIHLFASNAKVVQLGKQRFVFHQVKPVVLFNQLGVESVDNYLMASRERAICDSLYLSSNLAFDNLNGVDWSKLKEIAQIYNNKRLLKDIKQLITLQKVSDVR